MRVAFLKWIAIGVAGLTIPGIAQTTVLSPAEASHLTAEGYIDRYQTKIKDYSTGGTVQAAAEFVTARKAANTANAEKNLSFFYKTRLSVLRSCLETIGITANRFHSIHSGGGTIYATFSAYGNAQREEWLTGIIAMLSKTRVKDDAARTRASQLFGKSASKLMAMQTLSPPVGSKMEEGISLFRKQHLKAQGARIRLIAIGAALPDRVAEKIARRLLIELQNGEMATH